MQGPPGTTSGSIGVPGNPGDQGRPGEQGPQGIRGKIGGVVQPAQNLLLKYYYNLYLFFIRVQLGLQVLLVLKV